MKRIISFLTLLISVLIPALAQNAKVDSLLNIVKTSNVDSMKVDACNLLFIEFEYTDEAKAKDLLNQALELSKKTGYKKGLSYSYTNFAYLAEDKGDFPGALENHFKALGIRKQIHDARSIAESHVNVGLIYYYQGNYPAALKNFFTALRIKDSALVGPQKVEANAYNNIGLVYIMQKNYTGALKNHLAALKIREQIGDTRGVAGSYNNIGNVYLTQLNYMDALKNFTAALKINREVGNLDWAAVNYNNIGNVYKGLGNYTEALKNYEESVKIKAAIGERSGLAGSYLNMGGVFIEQKRFKEAERHLIKARDLSLEIGFKEILKDAYGMLTKLDSAKGNYKGAFENQRLFMAYRDSLDNEESRKQTIQTQMTYDFEKREAVAAAEHQKELESQKILAEEKERKQTLVLFMVLGSLLLVVIFSAFIFRSLRITRAQKTIIEEQKNIVEANQKEILDSIRYARRIQRSLMPAEKYIDKHLNRLMKK